MPAKIPEDWCSIQKGKKGKEMGTGREAKMRRLEDEGGGEQVKAEDTVRVGAFLVRYDEHSEDLLPGLPNVITMDLIVPKLPWRAFHILSSVRRCWRHAIRSHQVYDARVRFRSTDI